MKLPLAIGEYYVCGVRIVDADRLPIGSFSDAEWADIVRRVNAHDGLVNICRKLVRADVGHTAAEVFANDCLLLAEEARAALAQWG